MNESPQAIREMLAAANPSQARPQPSAPRIIASEARVTAAEWDRLRRTVQSGVANGVILAGLVLLLIAFALNTVCGVLRV